MSSQPSIYEVKNNLLMCSNPEHQGEPIDYICTEPECLESEGQCGLLCYLCQEEQKSIHQQHEIMTTRSIINQIQSIDYTNFSILAICAAIDISLQDIKRCLESHRTEFENYQEVISSFQKEEDWMRKKCNVIVCLKESFHRIFSEAQGDKCVLQNSFKKFLRKNLQVLVGENLSLGKNKTVEEKSITIMHFEEVLDEIEDLQSKIKKLHTEGNLNNYQVLSLFSYMDEFSLNSSSTKMYYFSKDLMGTCHQMVSPTIAEAIAGGQQRMLILQPCLESNRKIKKWRIKIKKLASWIGVGACHFNKVKQANFHFNYGNPGHGSYLLSSNGYSWSSYKTEFNSKHGSFAFKTDDIVCLQYHPQNGLLIFRLQKTEKQFQLQTQKNGDKLHPAVNLTGIGDSVEIII